MGCGVFWQQVGEIDRALRSLRVQGIGPGFGPYQELWKLRGRLMGQIGFKVPRQIQLLLRIAGLSPGSIDLWYDVESGWYTDARVSAGAPAVRRRVSDDVAVALLRGELTHELELELMAPDYYVGE